MTLAQLSGNRFMVGIGASGPQVVEGWHGVAYGRPVTRLKEYVQIMRRIFARGRARFGQDTDLSRPRRTGLGKPLKSILHLERRSRHAATLAPPACRRPPRSPIASSV
jgi:alkanesulfonate monooxygenase SsuD/methylene tetrahydromethanopterin reductase-like flavin-dependent oxidoreductase (luciferase family)